MSRAKRKEIGMQDPLKILLISTSLSFFSASTTGASSLSKAEKVSLCKHMKELVLVLNFLSPYRNSKLTRFVPNRDNLRVFRSGKVALREMPYFNIYRYDGFKLSDRQRIKSDPGWFHLYGFAHFDLKIVSEKEPVEVVSKEVFEKSNLVISKYNTNSYTSLKEITRNFSEYKSFGIRGTCSVYRKDVNENAIKSIIVVGDTSNLEYTRCINAGLSVSLGINNFKYLYKNQVKSKIKYYLSPPNPIFSQYAPHLERGMTSEDVMAKPIDECVKFM